MSRLQQVVGLIGDAGVTIRDLDGRQTTASLLAYDGPAPEVGDWVVAQSGFVLAPADPEDARAARSELETVRDRRGR